MKMAKAIQSFCDQAVRAADYQGSGSRLSDVWANHDDGRTRITGEIGGSLIGVDILGIVEGDDLDILLATLGAGACMAICLNEHHMECLP